LKFILLTVNKNKGEKFINSPKSSQRSFWPTVTLGWGHLPSEAKASKPYNINIFVWNWWIFKILFLNINFWVFLRFDFFQKWWRHHESYQILVPNLATFSIFWSNGSKSPIFGENKGLYVPNNLWKMAIGIDPYRKWQSFDQTGSEKIFESEVKNRIYEKLVKNCLESSILVFSYLVTGRR